MGDLHVPGIPGRITVKEPDPQVELLTRIFACLDQMFQLQARIALGWQPADAVRDMRLNVPDPPGAEGEAKRFERTLQAIPNPKDGDE